MRRNVFKWPWTQRLIAVGLCVTALPVLTAPAVTAMAADAPGTAAEAYANVKPASVSLQADGNKVFICIDETDWTYYNLTVTWEAGVALADAESGARVSDALKLAIAGGGDSSGVQTYNDAFAGEFYAAGAFTTDTGVGCDFAGTAYVLEFDTDEELTVTCGEQSITINAGKPAVTDEPTQAPTVTAKPEKSAAPEESAQPPGTEPATTDEPGAAPMSILCGDADENGKVEVSDALVVLKSVVKLTVLSGTQTMAADIDADAAITASDALLILKKVVQLIDTFPAEAQQLS